MISNDACTGWKLQGAIVDNIYAIEWFPACKNWVYVILSRVKKRTGLYLRRPISKNISDYRLNRKLVTMMGIMDKVTCKPINEDKILDDKFLENGVKLQQIPYITQHLIKIVKGPEENEMTLHQIHQKK